MDHKVFISHSSKDSKIATAICHYLEEAGIRCWIAPRDIHATDWAGCIMRGIQTCDVFVVILSGNSIPSQEVTKEVTEATRVCQYILPFKVDEEMLSDRLRYHLAPCHWLDAVNPPLERHIQTLIDRICHLSAEDQVYQNTSRQKLVGHLLSPKAFFIGRDEELAQIHSLLEEEPVLFLQGMGGIGKSEIAKAYAKAYADSYDTVLFANYQGSIMDMIAGDDIEIENFRRNLSYGTDGETDEAYFKRKLKAIQSLSTSRTLLIIDNYDVEFDPHMEPLLAGPYRALITTRYLQEDYTCLPIGPIQNSDAVRQLFQKHYGRSVPPKEQPALEQLLELVQSHTITVELLAKQMRASFLTPEKMLAKLMAGGVNSGLKERVHRSGSSKNAFDYITDLFALSTLTEEQQQFMSYMCLVPHSGIDIHLLEEYLELDSLDVARELINQSWLMLDEESYCLKMHPIICDVVRHQLHPDPVKCSAYVMGLWKDMKDAWWKTNDERLEKWPLVSHILRCYPQPFQALLQQYMDFSNIAWICGQFTQSIEAAKRVYRFVLETGSDAGYQPAFAARTVAGAYFNAGDEAGAEPYYRLALEHILKKPEESYVELGYNYQKVARCAYTRHDFDQAEEYLRASLEAFQKGREAGEATTPVTHVDSYVFYARMYMTKGAYETALTYAQKAYDTLYSWKNCEVTSSAYSLSDMGICHSHLGHYQEADQYLQRALELNRRFNGEASMVTVRTRESIADNLARQGQWEQARTAYLTLEMEMEKNFGSSCHHVARLHQKGEAMHP